MRKSQYYSAMVTRELYYSARLSCIHLGEKINKSVRFSLKILHKLIEVIAGKEPGHHPSNGGRRPFMHAIKGNTIYISYEATAQLITRIPVMSFYKRHVRTIEKFEWALRNNPVLLVALSGKLAGVIQNSSTRRNNVWAWPHW